MSNGKTAIKSLHALTEDLVRNGGRISTSLRNTMASVDSPHNQIFSKLRAHVGMLPSNIPVNLPPKRIAGVITTLRNHGFVWCVRHPTHKGRILVYRVYDDGTDLEDRAILGKRLASPIKRPGANRSNQVATTATWTSIDRKLQKMERDIQFLEDRVKMLKDVSSDLRHLVEALHTSISSTNDRNSDKFKAIIEQAVKQALAES